MGTHPIFESDFDCLTEIRTKMTEQETPTVTETPTVVTTEAPAMETEAVAPPQLTVDMGPEKLDRVPEHLLKRRKQYQGMKRKEKEDQGNSHHPVQTGRALSTRRQVELARLHPHGPQSAQAHHQQGPQQDGAGRECQAHCCCPHPYC